MDNGQKTMKISTRFVIVSGSFLVLTCTVIVAIVNYSMKQQALAEAEAKINIMAEQYFAIHTYFSQKLKPSLFEFTKPIRSEEYFDPTWMSSTYAIREIIKYIRLAGGDEYYLKDAAVNARSPENEASPLEKDFISALNTDPKLKIRSSVEVIDGKPYLVLQRRGELLEASCFRCHSSPEQAPGDLIRYYGAERSFHRKIGDWVSAISIKVPLSSTYRNANRFSLKLSGFLLTTLLVFFVVLYWLNNRLVFKPLSLLQEKALEISNSKELLGEEIPLPSGRELKDLTSAFNKMSISLRYHMDYLEGLVKDRTDELLKTNEQLKLEIEERRPAEEALRESEEKYRSMVEATEDSIYLVDRNCAYLFMNKKHLSRFGCPVDKVVGREYGDFHSAEKTKEFTKRVKEVFETGKSISYEYRSERDRGYFLRTLSPIKKPDGKLTGVTVISKNITERKQTEENLRQTNEALSKAHNQRKILSKRLIDLLEKDRRQIAMELHDHIGQTLTSIKMDIEMIHGKLKPEQRELGARITAAQEKAIQAIKDIRNISRGLRPGILDALGLIHSLRELFNEIQQQTDIEIRFFSRGIPERFAPEKEIAIYRIAQEAMTNVIRNAKAKNVFVNLVKKDETLSLSVEDDGVGFDQDKEMKHSKGMGRLGLLIMRERAIQLDGEFTIESQPGKGTHLLVEIPL